MCTRTSTLNGTLHSCSVFITKNYVLYYLRILQSLWPLYRHRHQPSTTNKNGKLIVRNKNITSRDSCNNRKLLNNFLRLHLTMPRESLCRLSVTEQRNYCKGTFIKSSLSSQRLHNTWDKQLELCTANQHIRELVLQSPRKNDKGR